MSIDTKTTEAVAERRRLDSNEFRDIIGRFASGVTVITVEHEDQRYGTTASAVCSLSLEPPMLLVCLNKSSSTGQAIAAARHFAVNILGEGQADAAMRFAGKGDKFAGSADRPRRRRPAAPRGRAGQPGMPRRRGGHRRHAHGLPRRGRAGDRWPWRAARLLPRAVRPPRAQAGRRGPPRHPRPGLEPRAARGRAAEPRRGRRARGRPARLGLSRAHQAERRGTRHAHRRRPVRRDPAHGRVRVGRPRGAPRHRARRGRRDGRPPVRPAAAGVPQRGAGDATGAAGAVRHRRPPRQVRARSTSTSSAWPAAPRWSTCTAASTRRT